MPTPQEIADKIWKLPSTEIIELPDKIIEIIKDSSISDLEAIELSEKYLPLIKRILEEKINDSIKNDNNPKFIFSETSPERLIGSENIGNIKLLMQLSDEIVNLIYQINGIQESKGQQKIFELTPRTFKSQSILHKPVKNENALGEFIDALYFIVYEGSKDLSRIPKNMPEIFLDNGNKFKEDFIGIEIKNLRSYFRHDPYLWENPQERIRLFSNICNKYVNKNNIALFNVSDFLKLQECLLKELKKFLISLKSNLSSNNL